MKCKQCGRPLDPDSQFCKFCGTRQPVQTSTSPRRPVAVKKSPTGANIRVAPASKTKRTPSGAVVENKFSQLPRWVIPAACITAAALLITGIVVMILGNRNNAAPVDTIEETNVVITTPPPEVTEIETETETETEPPSTEAPFDTDVEWAQAYYDTILEFEQEHTELNPDKGLKYRLLYIDDNEVPELFMQAGEASALYTYTNGESKRIYDARTDKDEKLVGVRTRRGTYLSCRTTENGERYAVNTLQNGTVSETESYRANEENYTINGASVDLVAYTEYVRAKQASYQLTDIPQYTKADLLDAMLKAADGGELPEMAGDEEEVDLPETSETDDEEETGEKRFEVYAGDVTWSQAQARCKEKGGHLAYIKSQADWDAVMAAVRKADGSLSYLWVGGETTIQEDGETVVAKWTDGSSTSYLDSAKLWFGHEPSGRDGNTIEPYMMLWNPGSGWSFNDNSDSCVKIYASGTIGYVCQFDE
ncbi:MAG: hypothetical protein II916_02360 [Oscillospiraceae bacterium]|nr:hypothetical protein [Oscillospiraceae bacterium]